MRAMNKSKEQNLELLLQELKEKQALTTEEICALLDVNKNSVPNYIETLKGKLYQIEEIKIGRKKAYRLTESEDNHYLPLDFSILRKYAIIQALQGNKQSLSDLKKLFPLEESSYADTKLPIDIKNTSFDKLIKELEAEKIIVFQDGQYCLTGNIVPLILSLDENSLYNLYYELTNIASGNPFVKPLQTVFQKISELVGNPEPEEVYFENYIIYGKRYEHFHSEVPNLKKLMALDYENKLLNIKAEGYNQNFDPQYPFAIGMIIYSVEKDSFFLLGERKQKDGSDFKSPIYASINIETIQEISETDYRNINYLSEQYQKLFEQMFSVSIDNPEKVLVEFQSFPNIKQKLEQLEKQRSSARLEESGGKLLYSDTIRGRADFARFLRSLGDNVRVLESSELKDKMIFSINESLKNYEEVQDV